MLGAELIHLESTPRPDGTRLIAGIPATEPQWWERSPIFSALNTNKKGLTLDFQTERGRELLRRLIPTCDVIVENFTPRVIDQLGLDFASVRELRDDMIMVRMPGFGLDGPWRDNPAFAYIIEDASGLSWLTGYPDRNPYEPYSVGDPNAGVHALNALLLALEHRRRTGQGVLVEAAMVDAALNIAAEQVIEHSAYGTLLQRNGQPRTGGRAAEHLPMRTTSTSSAAPTAGWRSRWRTTSSGRRCARRSAARLGDGPTAGRRRRDAGLNTTSSMSVCRSGACRGPATRSSKHSGLQAFRWPR